VAVAEDGEEVSAVEVEGVFVEGDLGVGGLCEEVALEGDGCEKEAAEAGVCGDGFGGGG
jgi:hypothetical protein